MAVRGRKVQVPVNGTEQGMFLTGEVPDRPVLLFLHGGPGLPEYWLTRRYPTGFEQAFTVAWWEQRGSALSRDWRLASGQLTVPRLIDDTVAVAEHLQRRFEVAKVYLVGHSWGSFLGIQTAARAPGLFHAYVGIGQVTDQIRSEALAREHLVEYYRRLGDQRMVRRLGGSIPARPPLPRSYLAVRDRAMHRAGVGTTREMRSVVSGLFVPSLTFDEYTPAERVKLWLGKVVSRRSPLWDGMLSTDLTQVVRSLSVPAYFLHGRHDYTSSYELARRFAGELSAPVVGFYTFADSAHSPQFEEPARTMEILTRDVLNGTVHLADPWNAA